MFKAVCYHPDECQIITVGTDRKVLVILLSSVILPKEFLMIFCSAVDMVATFYTVQASSQTCHICMCLY